MPNEPREKRGRPFNTTSVPARHIRNVVPRVCATCIHGDIQEAERPPENTDFMPSLIRNPTIYHFVCDRRDGLVCEDVYHYAGGIPSQWFTTCDGYEQNPDYAASFEYRLLQFLQLRQQDTGKK